MTAANESEPRGRQVLRALLEGLVVIGASLLLGGLTSPAQGFLPEGLSPFANSPSGWTLLTAVLVWAVVRSSALWAAVLGASSFVALLIGYQVVSTMRGFPDSEGYFTTIGLLVGPFIGTAAFWLHRRELRPALGVAVLAGIGLGDCGHGLLLLVQWTGWPYWVLIGAIALALLLAVLTTRMHRIRSRLVAVLGAASIAALYLAVLG